MYKTNETASYAGLAKLLHKSVATLRADRCRRPESLPPASIIPGSTRPIWIVSDVLDWLRQHQSGQTIPNRGKSATVTDTTIDK